MAEITALRIIDCDQGTPEWLEARRGLPTASMFKDIMSPGRGAAPSKQRRTYMLKLAAEIISGEPTEGFSTVHTERGHEQEAEAREWYAFKHDVDPQQVGLIVNGVAGYSPDSLIGAPGALEIKTKLGFMAIDAILNDEFLDEHKPQCQGGLWVAKREWIDLTVWSRGIPPFVKRAERDEVYIVKLERAVVEFTEELAEMVAKVRAYGLPKISEAA
ncbi:lambda exonuclease family protein [Caulobacter hibisci]|uniref:YqaJ viral recombinase family protein n=1 Tax=Caulobacter hibisci TaxID=2035993 RepID=A0ABS0SS04_9CAUL|nr:lambda exonuclease family protein [Caulobacter hibisci]MBI1682338.1 YqaJ viral recombinase family protein [Caulobacter hibisci]